MRRFIALLAAVAFLGACTTVDHRLDFKPVQTGFPVSMSGYFFGPDGKTVDPSGYTVVKHFAFEKNIVAYIKANAEKKISVDLTQEFEDLIVETGGDAIVNVTILPKGIDTNDETWLGVDHIVGGMFLGFGGMFLVMGLAMSDPTNEYGDPGETPMTMGWIFSGVGAGFAIHGLATETNGKRTWYFTVEGDVVKRR